jgi:hypothetical protein
VKIHRWVVVLLLSALPPGMAAAQVQCEAHPLPASAPSDAGWLALGVVAEAAAKPGTQPAMVGLEAAVRNEDPGNRQVKIAASAVFKNRADGAPDPGLLMNANSIAYWVTGQPGTGFERGLVFAPHSLVAGKAVPAAIDLSALTDEEIEQVDLIRIRKDVALRYDPRLRQLVLQVAPVPL